MVLRSVMPESSPSDCALGCEGPTLAARLITVYAMAVNEENAAGGRGHRAHQWRCRRDTSRCPLLTWNLSTELTKPEFWCATS